ncbi:uncharacterized protein LOC119297344 [Triticum dicoccoides]|uniref:uncharacterized protein LOC119297344 n=1 Tax=Triticum dicoccoides TaxID=85692 RepID=UPI00188ED1F4|nr:uncharacterized protein LOC119297344 [Triticum dicoccoides]
MDHMTIEPDERRAMSVAFSLLGSALVVAPNQRYPAVPDEILQCGVHPQGTGFYNLAKYGFEKLREAVRKFQADVSGGKKTIELGGCQVSAQIWVLDNMDFGNSNVTSTRLPRLSAYSGDKIKELIGLDERYPGRFKTKPENWKDNINWVWHSMMSDNPPDLGIHSPPIELGAIVDDGVEKIFRDAVTAWCIKHPGSICDGRAGGRMMPPWRSSCRGSRTTKKILLEISWMHSLLQDQNQ